MELSRVIVGPVTTEKSERLKAGRTYTVRVAPEATRIEVQKALESFYDVEVSSVRILHVREKTRMLNAHRSLTKRHTQKRALVTLAPKSKVLDLSQFKAS